ncbi:PHD finger protein 20-like isoform X2 [Maniola jurtina]|uniref:PHD finger protein 20-like isoform X2 n=1 Tax=Maniola jurtina TaxID=191418 RepID=UPI001E689522|nr:PHD finger protein 20-like isoform X2 [Maniola jurtina]
MAVKKCSIANCSSTLSSPEDIGVTYHKYPKDTGIRENWLSATRQTYDNIDNSTYVCSRHFCKSDFKVYQDSKYVLKSDAVPSIFSWNPNIKSNKMDPESITEANSEEQTHNTSSSSKESEEENVDAIQKCIDEQEIEIQNKRNQDETQEKAEMDNKQKSENPETPESTEKQENVENLVIEQVENVVLCTKMMDMILSVSEDKADSKKEVKPIAKQSVSPKGNNSIALSVGSKVVAKDFEELWYPAEIVEVDHDEMEVLVHYENVSNKPDEWINISSPRLRPINKPSTPIETPALTPAVTEVAPPEEQAAPAELVQEIKVEDKPKLHFVVGERCLARWRDNRRFIATIANDLSNGVYEVIFDDGFHWKCNTSRLYKLKDPGKHSECLSVDTSMPPKPSTPSPVQAGAGPSTASPLNALTPTPIFHTHLFDPTRDYLGPKSERREMKRKLNIKEIFNIGQKKKKKETPPKEKVARVVKEKKPRVLLRKIKEESVEDVKTEINTEVKAEVKTEIPDAVASIIGTVAKEDAAKPTVPEIKTEPDTEKSLDSSEVKEEIKLEQSEDLEEELKLENFEKPDESKKEDIEKMKEVISKLEVGLIKIEDDHQNRIDSPKPEPQPALKPELKPELKSESTPEPEIEVIEVNPAAGEVDKIDKVEPQEKSKRKLSKIKKSKKLRLLQEKKVKKQVEKVKSELEEMKRQVEEMRKQMLLKTEQPSPAPRPSEMPESFLLPGEWCCKWRDGQPVGAVSEIEGDSKMDANNKMALPRRSVQVEDKRLPEGWSKHMVRRRLGQSAGKWDVVLVSPTNHRFHTKNDMRNYLELNRNEELKPYEYALLDFGVHLKLSRRMGWYTTTVDGSSDAVVNTPVNTMSPLAKAKKYRVYRKDDRKEKKKKRKKQIAAFRRQNASLVTTAGTSGQASIGSTEFEATPMEYPALEDGYVYVGSLKVQILENLLRCPAEGCFKNFRNNTLLQMHIKHYHRELRKMLGATPKVLDLAQQRTLPTEPEPVRQLDSRILKIKITRPPKRAEEPKPELKVFSSEINVNVEAATPTKTDLPIPRSQDSPKLREALANKPVKRPKVLLPVRRPDPEPIPDEFEEESPALTYDDDTMESTIEVMEPQDFETAISTHTVTKPIDAFGKKAEKKRKCFSTVPRRPASEEDEWFGMNSDVETRSSFPGSGTPDSKTMDKVMNHQLAASSESAEEQKGANTYMFTETGERIKIEHMRREEIINCHCGFREEDGLMVQCELCLCWQHALCHNIQKESEVPEKYTCSICLNPRRGRRSKRFLHDQDRLYEGLLPGAKPCESLRRSHELSGNLLRIQDALHALRVKYYVATKKDHPKLYLWAKDWENAEVNFTQERLNSDYSDLNIIINNIGKENLPVKHEDVHLDLRPPLTDDLDHDRFSQRDSSNSLLNLTAALASPGGTLDLPITTSELERLAKSVQEQEVRNVSAPQPEAAIENGACRERLLRHVQRSQALIDARLDSIEAQVAELESQDPSFEDDETADYFPRTKQTIQMLMHDLDTMEELGIIT